MSDIPEVTKPKRRTPAAKKPSSSAVAKPTAKKVAAKAAPKPASKTTAKTKAGTKTTRSRKSPAAVTAEARYRMIADAAYFIAESNGFDNSRNTEYWLQAEAQIDSTLSGGTKH